MPEAPKFETYGDVIYLRDRLKLLVERLESLAAYHEPGDALDTTTLAQLDGILPGVDVQPRPSSFRCMLLDRSA